VFPCVYTGDQVTGLIIRLTRIRNCGITGVENSPKLLIVVNYTERGNPVPPPSGQANRKAS